MSNLEELQGTIKKRTWTCLHNKERLPERGRGLKDVKDFLGWRREWEQVFLNNGNDIHEGLTMRMWQVKEQEKSISVTLGLSRKQR